MNVNNVVHVTPPSLYLGVDGISVLFLGFDESNIDEFQSVFEKHLYDTELQFFYSDKENNEEETVAWKYLISCEVDFILVNVDDCVTEDLVIALMSERKSEDAPHLMFITNAEKDNLSNLIQKYTGKVVRSVEEFEEIIKYILEEE